MSATRKKATIVAARMLSPSVRSLVLAPHDGPLQFVAGQWVNLHVSTGQGWLKRAYSIASAPQEATLELAVTLVAEGEVSPLLHKLDVGGQVELDGPHGFFTREGAESAPTLFVGTGTGLAPLRSMLLAAAHEPSHPPTTLLFGCRTQEDILWRDELEALARTRPSFSLVCTLSRPDDSWLGRRGYVQEHVVEQARALGEPHVFICGLNRMVSEVRSLCKGSLGYDRKRIHSERYD